MKSKAVLFSLNPKHPSERHCCQCASNRRPDAESNSVQQYHHRRLDVVIVQGPRISQYNTNDRQQTSGANSSDASPGEHHGHVRGASRDSAAEHEEEDGKLHGDIPPIDVGDGCKEGEEDSGGEEVGSPDVSEARVEHQGERL